MLLVLTLYHHSGRQSSTAGSSFSAGQNSIAPPKPLPRTRRAARGHAPDAGCLWHPNALYLECYCARRRHQGCYSRKRRFRYVAALFGQLSGKLLLACIWWSGVSDAKHNGWSVI